MRIRILGAGFYGCHIGLALHRSGHEIEVHDIAPHIFAGASGGIPARLHCGAHYPRSRLTRAACQEHAAEFMKAYGHLTRAVPINVYAIAAHESLIDFEQYLHTLQGEMPFIPVDPIEFGITNCEGAILTGERHILTAKARAFFEAELKGHFRLGITDDSNRAEFDLTIDCTFGSNSAAAVDRYEPCLVVILHGRTDRAVTVMDGPFGSLYPWDEERDLCSLSSARWTPFRKDLQTYADAQSFLESLTRRDVLVRAKSMVDDMARFYPALMTDFDFHEFKLSIRAMPRSGADTRLVDVQWDGPDRINVRAGKIDAIIHAEKAIREMVKL